MSATVYHYKATKSTPQFIEVYDGYHPAKLGGVFDSKSPEDGSPQYEFQWDFSDLHDNRGAPLRIKSWVRVPPMFRERGELSEKSRLYEVVRALGYDDDDLDADPNH